MNGDQVMNPERSCPSCGRTMQMRPRPKGAASLVCPHCGYEEGVSAPPGKGQAEDDPVTRFRRLLADGPSGASANSLPSEFLEDLPEEVQAALKAKAGSQPSVGSAKDDITRSLRHEGYAVDQDAHGLRLSTVSGGTPKGPGLSSYDIVRLAADLGGGIVPAEKRIYCAKCKAAVPAGAAKCQWCGEPVQSPPGPSSSG